MKKRVKFLDSVAGLADPRPAAELEEKYQRMRIAMRKPTGGREKGLSDYAIETTIAETKKRDRFGEKGIGFKKDFSFRPGDEAAIDADLADAWEASGICTVLSETKKAA